MMDNKEVKLLILFLAVAANSGCCDDNNNLAYYGPPPAEQCCGERYERGDPKLDSCLELEAKGQCGAAVCCDVTYPFADDLDYLACIKEAADNGCPGQTLYGPPLDQSSQ